MKKIFIICLLLSSFISFVNLISAFGVVSSYGPGYPFQLYPGETKDVQFRLIASPGEDNLTIRVELVENGSVASLIDSDLNYKLNAGGEVPINIRISVNKTAKVGEEHSVVIRLTDVTPSEGGGSVAFKGASTITLNVLVTQPELKETKAGIWLLFILGFFVLVAIVSVILIIWVIIRIRRDKL